MIPEQSRPALPWHKAAAVGRPAVSALQLTDLTSVATTTGSVNIQVGLRSAPVLSLTYLGRQLFVVLPTVRLWDSRLPMRCSTSC